MYEQSYKQSEPMPEYAEVDRAPGIVDEFYRLSESLSHEIHLLSERLAPVLKPEFTEQQKILSEPAPLRSSVRTVHDDIERQVRRLAEIRTLLEL